MTQITLPGFETNRAGNPAASAGDAPAPGNALLRIAPYWHHRTWAFDDDAHGLVAEPFVCGAEKIIDRVLVEAGIDLRAARSRGIRLTFSAGPFPGAQAVAARGRPEAGGFWYRTDEPAMDGWLCPALFHYFAEAPERLFIRGELAEEEVV